MQYRARQLTVCYCFCTTCSFLRLKEEISLQCLQIIRKMVEEMQTTFMRCKLLSCNATQPHMHLSFSNQLDHASGHILSGIKCKLYRQVGKKSINHGEVALVLIKQAKNNSAREKEPNGNSSSQSKEKKLRFKIVPI